MSRQWDSKSNTEENRHGLGSLWPSVLYRLEKTECIISRNLLLLPHDTSGGGGPSRYDEAPFSHWERMFAYYFIIPPGPQENKPISCHCDRIKMEPSYFCNTMQAGREEKEGQWVRERQIGHHLPIKPMNYGAASFSRKDYRLILSPRDNYSKVQLLASVSGPAPQVLTHTRFTHLFSHSTTVNLHDGSDLSTAASSSAPPPFFFSVPHWAHGPMSPLEPNVSFSLAHSVFGPICVPACVCIEWAKRVWYLDFTSQDVWAGDSDERGAERRPLVHSLV